MSDRLQELLRQRAAIAQHLAWLDREIASQSPTSATPPRAESIVSAAPPEPPLPPIAGTDPEKLLAQLRRAEGEPSQLSKQGCWTLFVAALLVVGTLLGALIYLRYS